MTLHLPASQQSEGDERIQKGNRRTTPSVCRIAVPHTGDSARILIPEAWRKGDLCDYGASNA